MSTRQSESVCAHESHGSMARLSNGSTPAVLLYKNKAAESPGHVAAYIRISAYADGNRCVIFTNSLQLVTVKDRMQLPT